MSPIYEYECRSCGRFEKKKPIKDRHWAKCPKCQTEAERIPSVFSFKLVQIKKVTAHHNGRTIYESD